MLTPFRQWPNTSFKSELLMQYREGRATYSQAFVCIVSWGRTSAEMKARRLYQFWSLEVWVTKWEWPESHRGVTFRSSKPQDPTGLLLRQVSGFSTEGAFPQLSLRVASRSVPDPLFLACTQFSAPGVLPAFVLGLLFSLARADSLLIFLVIN